MTTREPVNFRRAVRADWPAVQSLLQDSGLPIEGAEACLETMLVAATATRLVACAALELHGDVALLRSCAVETSFRGSGLGSTLTRQALALARQLGIRQLALLTTTAEDYFPRFGFVRVARKDLPDAIQQSAEFRSACPASAITMLLKLDPS